MVRVIIAGGRNYRMSPQDFARLDELSKSLPITLVLHGECTGADRDGEMWAKSRGVPFKGYPAKWREHGKAAGPIRNRQMAEQADAVVVFPGGRGTDSMRKIAHELKLEVVDA